MVQDVDVVDPRLKELQDEAWSYLKAYLSAEVIQSAALTHETGPKSQVTISRYFGRTGKPRRFKDISAWTAAINPIFLQVRKLAEKKGVSPSWHQVFGPNVPEFWASESTAIARPRVSPAKLQIASMPLVEELKERYEAERKHDNVWKKSELLVRLCSVLELAAKWDELPDLLDTLAKLNARTGDFHFEADARLRQAQALFQLEDFEKAGEAISKGLSVIAGNEERTPPYRTQLRLLNYLAAILMKRGDHGEALEVLGQRCLPLAMASCSDSAVANVHNRLGVVNLALDRVPEAEKELLIALRSRLDFGMLTEAARTLGDLGRASLAGGIPARAVLLFELSLSLHRTNNDDGDLPKAALACGFACLELQQHPLPLSISSSPSIIKDRELQPMIRRVEEFLLRPITLEFRTPRAVLEKAKEHFVVARYLSADDRDVFTECQAAITRADGLLRSPEPS